MEKVQVKQVEKTTHDVMHIRTEKPDGMNFTPGQAADVALDDPKWKDEKRPFTFTSLPSQEDLEFNIKVYPEHNGVTEQIGKLEAGDHLLLGEVFGAIEYKGTGVFLAGGAGITPFIAILKDLQKEGKIRGNKLIFANKTKADIILQNYFDDILGSDFINILSREEDSKYKHGHIDKNLIADNSDVKNSIYYLCGPPPMMDAVLEALDSLGVPRSRIVMEDF